MGNDLVSVKVEGLSKLVKSLSLLGVELEDVREVFGPLSREAARLLEAFAPKVSGALAASARPGRSKNRATASIGRKSVPYAGRVAWQPGFSATGFGLVTKVDAVLAPTVIPHLEAAIGRLIREKGLA
jgi:hypothetical protein